MNQKRTKENPVNQNKTKININKKNIEDSNTIAINMLKDYEDQWKNNVISETKKNIFVDSRTQNRLAEANLYLESLTLKLKELEKMKDHLSAKEDEMKKHSIDELTDKLKDLRKIKEERLKNISDVTSEVSYFVKYYVIYLLIMIYQNRNLRERLNKYEDYNTISDKIRIMDYMKLMSMSGLLSSSLITNNSHNKNISCSSEENRSRSKITNYDNKLGSVENIKLNKKDVNENGVNGGLNDN